MKLNIICGDIFSVHCDAYVNPTDIKLSGSGGLDKEIHLRGGASLDKEYDSLRSEITPGGTVISSGGELPVKYILHTVCTKRADDDSRYSQLAKCCERILQAAASKADLHHLAMPLVGTGIAGYPLAAPFYGETSCSLTAITILSTIFRFHRGNLHTVTIVCSSKEKYDLMMDAFRWISGKGISTRSRIRGSLLGGAVGDALGYPVEFHDAGGSHISEYVLDKTTEKALISDDTQMTLFTACGLLWGYSRSCMRGISADMWHYIAIAYDDWLKTQYPDYRKKKPTVSWIRNIPELNARRAPGITCLSALQAEVGSIQKPANNSKGCGGVMRIAPIALYGAANKHWDQAHNATICAEAAAITHGHPLGWLSAAALGNILYDIMENFSLDYAVQDTILLLQSQFAGCPDVDTMVLLLKKAVQLASISGCTSSYNLMAEYNITGQLGEGWVGEEALAVGLFCALACAGSDFDQCVRNAIWHKGDSDSTASIAGQIFGAYFGETAIGQKWLTHLELREVITEIAEDLANDCQMCEYGSYYDGAWVRKYLSGENSTHIAAPNELPRHKFIQFPWPDEEKPFRTVYHYDADHNVTGQYQILIENGTIYHVTQNKTGTKAGFSVFDFAADKGSEKAQANTERCGWVKLHRGNTVTGYYNNYPFTLVPNYADQCVEIFSDTTANPWIGRIRRKFTEWGNPIEFEMREDFSPLVPLEIIITGSEYLRDFFGSTGECSV